MRRVLPKRVARWLAVGGGAAGLLGVSAAAVDAASHRRDGQDHPSLHLKPKAQGQATGAHVRVLASIPWPKSVSSVLPQVQCAELSSDSCCHEHNSGTHENARHGSTRACTDRNSAGGKESHRCEHRCVHEDDSSNTKSTRETGAGSDPMVLYQYAPCPFCNKVRVFMDYHRIPYIKVEVEPLRKKQLTFSDYKKVPVLLADGEQINDSAVILARLAERVKAQGGPHFREPSDEERKWMSWVDERLVHLLPANIYRTPRESLQSFDYLLNASFEFSASERVLARYSGAAIMYLLCKFKLNKKYGIQDPRQEIYQDVDAFVNALNGRDFMSGTYKPGSADLAVYAAINSLEGLDAFRDIMANTRAATWYQRTKAAVGLSTGRYATQDDDASAFPHNSVPQAA